VISSIKIEAFRGVKEGQLDGLGPINILVGPNNSGKSTCLEAIALVGAANDAAEVVRLLLHRGGPALDALDHVVPASAKESKLVVSLPNGEFYKCRLSVGGSKDPDWDPERVDHAKSQGLKDEMRRVAISLAQTRSAKSEASPRFLLSTYVDYQGRATSSIDGNGYRPYAVQLVDVQTVRERGTLEGAYTSIEKAGRVKSVVQALTRSMKGLTDLRILKSGEDFILHAIFDGQPPVPVYLTGDGSKRLVELASAILGVDPDGVVLLEEPECFQHPRYLRELASLLIESAKAKRQIILSTHSIELVDLLLEAAEAEGLEYPFVHRLRLVDGKLSGVVLNREQAMVTRKDLLEDLRA
jgi:energy-coupling factor transporter ATP-binding protein EcfA2